MQWLVAFVLSEAGFRLITLYQTMHDNIHVKSGQDLPLKLQYIRTEKEAVMGWVCLGCLSAGVISHCGICRSLNPSKCTLPCHKGCRRVRLLAQQMLLRGG